MGNSNSWWQRSCFFVAFSPQQLEQGVRELFNFYSTGKYCTKKGMQCPFPLGQGLSAARCWRVAPGLLFWAPCRMPPMLLSPVPAGPGTEHCWVNCWLHRARSPEGQPRSHPPMVGCAQFLARQERDPAAAQAAASLSRYCTFLYCKS